MMKNSLVAILLPVLLAPAVAQTSAPDTLLQVTTNAMCGGANKLPSDPALAAASVALQVAEQLTVPELYVQRSAGCVAAGTPIQQLCVSYYNDISGRIADEITGFELLSAGEIQTACMMPMENCAEMICMEAVKNASNLVKTNCTGWDQCN